MTTEFWSNNPNSAIVCLRKLEIIMCLLLDIQGELSSISGTESRSLSVDVATWNPFEDAQPFNQLTEDHIFGAEFDKIRRGSNSSISGVKSRESLVMTYTELPEDPFESAPFSMPGKFLQ